MLRFFLLAAVLILTACGGSTIQKFRTGLATTAKVAGPVQNLVQSDAFCRPVLTWCKLKAKNPCPPLESCIKIRKGVLQAFISLGEAMQLLNESLKLYEELKGVKDGS
jgi:hypothetical protein